MDIEDVESCYRAVKARDRRFDGVFCTGVTSTGIYCRPSCPARTPHRNNVRFFHTAAAAQLAGFRACKRCRPDAAPGSPEWDVVGDLSGRAMRLIADGVVEREGVDGLARRVGYTGRHLNRLLTERVGAGPLALARARRAQTARILIETTAMPFSEVAFASGFASIRQFNATVQEVYASTPGELRGRRGQATSPGAIELRLAVRRPFAWRPLLDFLTARAVPGVERVDDVRYSRTLRLPHGHGVVRLEPGGGDGTWLRCTLALADVRDLPSAVERCRRLVDADADPEAVDATLGEDPLLAALVSRRPGLRLPGHVDGAEAAVRAVLGQQVSVSSATASAGRLVREYGDPLEPALAEQTGLSMLFPLPGRLARVDPPQFAMPRARGRALHGVSTALAEGAISLDRGRDRAETVAALRALPGIGDWTAGYIAMRALGEPDAFLPSDLGVRDALGQVLGLGRRATTAEAEQTGPSWRPWRSYALMHLWASLTDAGDAAEQPPARG